MEKLTLDAVPDSVFHGRRVLVRVDYNVPLGDGRVADDTRIRATLPTLHYLIERGARVVIVSHLGRPDGKRRSGLSLEPVAAHLAGLVSFPVRFVADVAGEAARAAADELENGAAILLENVRFEVGEEANDATLSEALATLADVYVNDAFGAAHRAHASTHGVAEVVRRGGRPALAGLLMARELRFLGGVLHSPQRPFTALLGGAKISGKIDVIESLLPRIDHLLIGGAMANTFFRALGLETGRSLVEEDRIETASALLERAAAQLVLPVDCVVAGEARAGVRTWLLDRDAVPPEGMILDIGPKSVATFRDFIERSRTLWWNGPLGLFEVEDFAEGTRAVARAAADATRAGAITIIGGGDTIAALAAAGLQDEVTHVSTGGGAALAFMEGRQLPGVAVLDDAKES